MSLTAPERETIVNASDGDTVVRIWTAQRKVITALRRRGATETRSGSEGTTEWAEFEVPAERRPSARRADARRVPRRCLMSRLMSVAFTEQTLTITLDRSGEVGILTETLTFTAEDGAA